MKVLYGLSRSGISRNNMKISGVWVGNRDIACVLKKVVDQGGELSHCGSGHYKVIPRDKAKKLVFVSGTPSDRRTIKNTVGKLRRSGFNL